MDKGLTVLILWPEIPSPKIYQPNSSAQAQTFGISLKKGASSGLVVCVFNDPEVHCKYLYVYGEGSILHICNLGADQP